MGATFLYFFFFKKKYQYHCRSNSSIPSKKKMIVASFMSDCSTQELHVLRTASLHQCITPAREKKMKKKIDPRKKKITAT
jgi:hypothetical protein